MKKRTIITAQDARFFISIWRSRPDRALCTFARRYLEYLAACRMDKKFAELAGEYTYHMCYVATRCFILARRCGPMLERLKKERRERLLAEKAQDNEKRQA